MMNMTQEVGKYFGYPSCCIAAYEDIQTNQGRKTAEQAYLASMMNTGFTPCPIHAKQIVAGTIKIESLIVNRICPLPFPQEPDMEVIDEYLTVNAGEEAKQG
jgi:hypothetical protein